MKTLPLLLTILFLTYSAQAGPRTSANYSIAADIADSGGRRSSSAAYSSDGSAGGLTGISTAAAPAEIAKSGYIGQLYDVVGLIVNSAQPTVNEGASVQLGAWQLLDDATFFSVDPIAVTWSPAVAPLASISAGGLATAQLVYQNTPASVQGTFGGFSGSLNFTVLDTIPDNFGAYAGDGIGDDWQVQYFGLPPNSAAGPLMDPDGDGATNFFEFAAGLIPTDPNSVFRLRLEAVPGQPTRRNIIFSPRLDGRTYIVASQLTLSGAWQPLVSSTASDNGAERTVTDLNATGGKKFYRVEIKRP